MTGSDDGSEADADADTSAEAGADPTSAARTVRPARAADAGALSRLQSHLAEPAPALLDAAGAVGTLLVSADADDRPVGYLLAVDGDDARHVAELVVAPGARREGRARALLRALFGRLSENTRVTVTVAADNDAACALYESVGFRAVERLPGRFASGDGVAYAATADES